MKYPQAFQDLVDSFKMLPGIGTKTAENLTYYILDMKVDKIEEFSQALTNISKTIKRCKICGNICEDEVCEICRDSSRDQKMICVVENIKDVYAMEKVREYHGLYHVLNGTISIIDGKTIDDLNVKSLFDRLDNVEEVIIATNPTREGETTALFLAKLLAKQNVKATRIANGLPIGSNIDYADELTLLKSLEGRKIIG